MSSKEKLGGSSLGSFVLCPYMKLTGFCEQFIGHNQYLLFQTVGANWKQSCEEYRRKMNKIGRNNHQQDCLQPEFLVYIQGYGMTNQCSIPRVINNCSCNTNPSHCKDIVCTTLHASNLIDYQNITRQLTELNVISALQISNLKFTYFRTLFKIPQRRSDRGSVHT